MYKQLQPEETFKPFFTLFCNMELHGHPKGPPARAICLILDQLKLDFKYIIYERGENFSEKFIKINPLKMFPAFIDGDLLLTESRAIMCYLVNKYGKDDDPLYPKKPEVRAMIDNRLYFDIGVLYKPYSDNLVMISLSSMTAMHTLKSSFYSIQGYSVENLLTRMICPNYIKH